MVDADCSTRCTALEVFPPYPCPNCLSDLVAMPGVDDDAYALIDRLIACGMILTVLSTIMAFGNLLFLIWQAAGKQ